MVIFFFKKSTLSHTSVEKKVFTMNSAEKTIYKEKNNLGPTLPHTYYVKINYIANLER